MVCYGYRGEEKKLAADSVQEGSRVRLTLCKRSAKQAEDGSELDEDETREHGDQVSAFLRAGNEWGVRCRIPM